MIKRIAFIAAVATLAGCSNIGHMANGLGEMTTSRTVGHWKGTQVCTTEAFGATQTVELKLEKGDMPLTSKGVLYIERKRNEAKIADKVWVYVRAESIVGGKAVIMGEQILKTEGSNTWQTSTWPGTFVDDNTMELTSCGSKIVIKRIADSAAPST